MVLRRYTRCSFALAIRKSIGPILLPTYSSALLLLDWQRKRHDNRMLIAASL